jgi:hypothetical protein
MMERDQTRTREKFCLVCGAPVEDADLDLCDWHYITSAIEEIELLNALKAAGWEEGRTA